MEIWEAEESDREALYEVHIASIRGVESDDYSRQELQTWLANISPNLYSFERSDRLFLVVEEDSELLGFVEALAEEQAIDKLYIRPEYQKQGIATALLEAAEEFLRKQGCQMIRVESSLNAAPFYERIGFQRSGRSETPTGLSTVILEKHLH